MDDLMPHTAIWHVNTERIVPEYSTATTRMRGSHPWLRRSFCSDLTASDTFPNIPLFISSDRRYPVHLLFSLRLGCSRLMSFIDASSFSTCTTTIASMTTLARCPARLWYRLVADAEFDQV